MLMFLLKRGKNMAHHGLECGWWIGESKEHNCGFIKTIFGFEHGLMLIPLIDPNVIVSSSSVKFRKGVSVMIMDTYFVFFPSFLSCHLCYTPPSPPHTILLFLSSSVSDGYTPLCLMAVSWLHSALSFTWLWLLVTHAAHLVLYK